MQLRYDNTLCSIDNKRAVLGHIRNSAQEYILRDCFEVLKSRVCTIQLHLGFQGHAIGKPTLKTFLYSITRRINEIIQKLKHEVVAGIRYGKVFGEHLVQTIILALLGWSIQLQEVFEGLQLHVEKIRIGIRIMHAGEINSVINVLCSHLEEINGLLIHSI